MVSSVRHVAYVPAFSTGNRSDDDCETHARAQRDRDNNSEATKAQLEIRRSVCWKCLWLPPQRPLFSAARPPPRNHCVYKINNNNTSRQAIRVVATDAANCTCQGSSPLIIYCFLHLSAAERFSTPRPTAAPRTDTSLIHNISLSCSVFLFFLSVSLLFSPLYLVQSNTLSVFYVSRVINENVETQMCVCVKFEDHPDKFIDEFIALPVGTYIHKEARKKSLRRFIVVRCIACCVERLSKNNVSLSSFTFCLFLVILLLVFTQECVFMFFWHHY